MTAKVARKEKRAKWISAGKPKTFQRWKEDQRREQLKQTKQKQAEERLFV